jgi:hypothetical protein
MSKFFSTHPSQSRQVYGEVTMMQGSSSSYPSDFSDDEDSLFRSPARKKQRIFPSPEEPDMDDSEDTPLAASKRPESVVDSERDRLWFPPNPYN